jgi:uncharacterized Zn finger protein
MSERSDWSCPYCDSSDVFRADGDLYECERCGLRTSEAREASLGHGAAIYLSDAQLSALGVDTDADQVRYSVKNGSLAIEGVSLDG